jgi:hypothetical protein
MPDDSRLLNPLSVDMAIPTSYEYTGVPFLTPCLSYGNILQLISLGSRANLTHRFKSNRTESL